MEKKSERKISNLFLKSDVQTSFALFLGLSIFSTGVIYITLFYQLSRYFQSTVVSSLVLSTEIESLLQEQFSIILVFMICFLFIFSLVTYFMAIRLSHRFVGPILKLEKVMQETIQTGVPTEVKFRPTDFFQSLPETFNKYTKVLQKNNER